VPEFKLGHYQTVKGAKGRGKAKWYGLKATLPRTKPTAALALPLHQHKQQHQQIQKRGRNEESLSLHFTFVSNAQKVKH
jgi:hypothetical protein